MEALILVDLQNDFMPGGALPVPDGNAVVPVANRLMPRFDLVVATQDWHPPDHGSFAASHAGAAVGDVIDLHGLQQILWPVHCVQNTLGADFHAGLDRARLTHIVKKGIDRDIDSYSGFFDNGRRKATGLGDYLRQHGAGRVYVLGLATDYCVKFTVLDALSLGFETHLVTDGCRGVNLRPGDADAAIDAMRAAGAYVTESVKLLK